MNITFLISENQKRQILFESMSDEMKRQSKENKNLIERIYRDASKQINFDLSIMLTFSASIAGFIGPVEQFLKDNYQGLTSMEISLILTGIIFQYIQDNKGVLKEIYYKIREKGLISPFRNALDKSERLKESFMNLVLSLGVSFQKTSNILGYTFLIPIIPILYQSISNGLVSFDDVSEIVKRLTIFGGLNYGGITLNQLIKSLIERIKSNQ
jgi:hypothetical protein